MLQFETLPASLAGLLQVFRPCFTAPSFRTFAALAAGLVAQPGASTVCGMLTGAGLSRVWHHSRAHWFFAGARWSPDRVGLALSARARCASFGKTMLSVGLARAAVSGSRSGGGAAGARRRAAAVAAEPRDGPVGAGR